MNTRAEDDEQREYLRQWREDHNPKGIRWFLFLVFGACMIAVALMVADEAEASVTIDTTAYQINLGSRNKIYFSRVGSVPLGTPCIDAMPALDAFVLADRMKVTLDAGRTSRPNQIFAKCGQAPPVIPPPTATTQVYTCPEAGANGRILESATVVWPNCPTASFQNPSRSLVVASNDDGVLRWLKGPTDGGVWTRTGTVEAWTRVEDIAWGATVPPPTTTPPPTGTAKLSWTAPTQNINGTPLTNLTGYRIYYGASPTALVVTIDVTSTTYTVPNLTAGKWYFAVTALTPTQESLQSNVVSTTLP